MANEVRVQHQRLVQIIRDALGSLGIPPAICEVEAEIMAEADLSDVPSHGIRMLPELMRGIRDGRITPNPNIKIIRDHYATCALDGGNGPGRYVSRLGMQQAMDRAKQFGVGVCSATRVTHWGRAHAYAARAADAGLIGLCTANTIPNMLAWGSSRPLLGNNPLAIAVPRAPGEGPLVLDMAMSQAAVGKVSTYLREGKSCSRQLGPLTRTAKPSDDPAAILASAKLLPAGDHKGAGLALMMEMLTAALAGGLFSYEIARSDITGLDPGGSKFFLALDMRAFGGAERFAQRVEDFVKYLRTAEPGLTITLPGERGWKTRQKNLAEGISIHVDIVGQLHAAGVLLDADISG